MNRSFKFPITLLVSLTLLSCVSCGDDDDDSKDGQSAISLAMKIDGADWEASKNIRATISFLSGDGTTDAAIIAGADDKGQSLQITTAREINGAGTYEIPSASGGGILFQYNDKTYVEKDLTIVIDEIATSGSSKFIRGTFHGTAENLHDETEVIVITDGSFDGID